MNYGKGKLKPGGIRAHSQRGSMGTTWLGKQWCEIAESDSDEGRLKRAKTYARQGHVMDLAFEVQTACGSVQGSKRKPYASEVQLDELGEIEWDKITALILKNPVFVSALLRNEYPEELERLLEKRDLQLLPLDFEEVTFSCDCDDDAIPCKHGLAVYLLIGEALDTDPYLLFELRGMDRGELLKRLQGEVESEPGKEEVVAPQPLPTDLDLFWRSSLDEQLPALVPSSDQEGGLALRLGSFPFWRGDEPFASAMSSAYKKAAANCLEALERTKKELEKEVQNEGAKLYDLSER